jgi:hypothetical protein
MAANVIVTESMKARTQGGRVPKEIRQPQTAPTYATSLDDLLKRAIEADPTLLERVQSVQAEVKPAAEAVTPKPVEVSKPAPKGGAVTMNHADFVRTAIVKLRKGGYKGIHSVYSGFNAAFGKHFGLDKAQTIAAVDKLAADGVIATRFVKGGVMLYLAEDAPVKNTEGQQADKALKAILG